MTDPASDRTHGYHLFFEPAGAIGEQLQELIGTLAIEFGSVAFMPHVTLLAVILEESEEVVRGTCSAIARLLAPFEILLGEPGMEDVYFRSLYLQAEKSPSLMSAHARAAAAFSMNAESRYTPHLSLLYGNYPDEQKRSALADLPVPIGAHFFVDHFSLYRTPGAAGSWQKIQEFPLRLLD